MTKRMPYPEDGGLGKQFKKFEDTFSLNDCLKIEMERRKQLRENEKLNND